jgi:hypothetical protein
MQVLDSFGEVEVNGIWRPFSGLGKPRGEDRASQAGYRLAVPAGQPRRLAEIRHGGGSVMPSLA